MIEIQNLKFKYASTKHCVFNDLSLTLGEGQIIGLLGKNGTGKSTLLYLLCGLLRPAAGRVSVDGCEPTRRDAAFLQDIFLVPEEFELPQVSMKQLMAMYRSMYPRFSEQLFEECLSDFDMPKAVRLNSLSMGQKKKVYMSLALATNTRYLLMDEPTNGLDIPSKSLFRKVMAKCVTDDRTIVISTHQVHDVEQLIDQVVIIDNDSLLMNSSIPDLMDRYSFGVLPQGSTAEVIYSEPSLQGYAAIWKRQEGEGETQPNMELLFNAVTQGKVKG